MFRNFDQSKFIVGSKIGNSKKFKERKIVNP